MRKGKTQHNYYSHIYFLSERQPDQKRKSTFLNGHHGDEKAPSLFLWDDSTLGNESDPHGGGDSSAERCCFGNNCSLYFLHIRNVRS